MTDSIQQQRIGEVIQRIAEVIQAHPRAEKHHCGIYKCWSYSLAEVIVEALQFTEEDQRWASGWSTAPDRDVWRLAPKKK